MEKKPVNIRLVNQALANCSFKLGGLEKDKHYSIDLHDEISVQNITDRTFELVFSRGTQKKDPFQVSVFFSTKVEVIDLRQLSENGETISEYAERVKDKLVDMLGFPSKASCLIANITREVGSPYISSPAILSKK